MVGLVTVAVGWKVYSSYWLEESSFAVVVQQMIWDFSVDVITLG